MEAQNANKIWWYESTGQQEGPISEEELLQLISSGKLTKENLIWKNGLGEWIKIKDSSLMPTKQTDIQTWWYNLNGQQIGPVSNEEISKLIKEGKLSADSMIWKQGMNNWMPVKHTEYAKRTNDFSSPPIPLKKWYNNKTKYWLSLLFWPLFIYATYKTDLFKKDTKSIIYIVLGLFIFFTYLVPNDKSESTNSKNIITNDIQFDHNMIVLGSNSYMANGNGWNNNIQWTFVIDLDNRKFIIANSLGKEDEYKIDDIKIDKNVVSVEGLLKAGNHIQRGQYYTFEVRNGSLTARLETITKLNDGNYNTNAQNIYKLTERFEY